MSTSEFVGLVLAGGKSSRMKTDKSYLIFENKTLLERAYNTLIDTGIAIVFVSGEHEGYSCISDQWSESGPAAAILSTLFCETILQYDYLLVLPIDMPLISSDLLGELMQSMDDKSIESSFFENKPLPCCIKISALKKTLKYYQEQPDISLKRLLTGKLCSNEIKYNTNGTEYFLNINTPTDLAGLRLNYET